MTDQIDPESERPTEPGSLRPHHVCEHCAPLIDEIVRLREAYQGVVRTIANPPWLPQLVEAASKVSAAVEIRGELADLKSRVAELSERVGVLESGCSERHPETPPPGMVT